MLSNSDAVFTGFIKSSAMRHINSPLRAAFHGWVALGRFTKISLCIFVVIGGLVVIGGATINSDPFSQSPRLDIFWLEKDKKAPVDYGYGLARALDLRGQTSSSVKPRQSPNPCDWPRKQHMGPSRLAEGRAAFLAPRFLGRSYRFTWPFCPTGAS
jgi:hypothetical protein